MKLWKGQLSVQPKMKIFNDFFSHIYQMEPSSLLMQVKYGAYFVSWKFNFARIPTTAWVQNPKLTFLFYIQYDIFINHVIIRVL